MAEQSLRDVRIDKRTLLEKEGVQVHPDRFERTHTIDETMKATDGTKVRTAGRIGQLRKFGKLTFATLQDLDGHIQLALMRGETPNYELFGRAVERWDLRGGGRER